MEELISPLQRSDPLATPPVSVTGRLTLVGVNAPRQASHSTSALRSRKLKTTSRHIFEVRFSLTAAFVGVHEPAEVRAAGAVLSPPHHVGEMSSCDMGEDEFAGILGSQVKELITDLPAASGARTHRARGCRGPGSNELSTYRRSERVASGPPPARGRSGPNTPERCLAALD